jgi:hypothetical protein
MKLFLKVLEQDVLEFGDEFDYATSTSQFEHS